MNLVVRPYTDADWEGYAHVKSKVYRSGEPIGAGEPLMRPDTFGTLIEADGRIVGIELDIDMTCTVRGDVLKCMGIAAVGVLPEFRRGGIGIEMLTRALPIYRERGAAIASLMPFRGHYYRKAGYALAGTRLAIRCPSERIPKLDSELEVWELPRDDYSAIVPCYEAFAKRYSGMNIRREEQWRWQLGGDNRFAIYAAGSPVEAYVSTRLKTDFWAEQEVRDFAWTTPRGYAAIMTFLRGLCMNKTAVKWWAPSDDPILWRHDDQGIEAKFDGPMQYRIVDVKKVLEAGSCETDGEFSMEVVDPHVAENSGVWRVAARGGKKTAEQTGGEADFTIGISALTQAALGEPSLDAVARQGAVDVRDRAGFEAAKKVLPPHVAFCLDFF